MGTPSLRIIPGRYELSGSTFEIEGRELLLRERSKPKKGQTTYYLMALPNQYVSALWPQSNGRFRFDFTDADDGIERMYFITFDGGYAVIEHGGISRRSASSAPWLRSARGR